MVALHSISPCHHNNSIKQLLSKEVVFSSDFAKKEGRLEEINYKYELLLKEILEHKDFSEILYEINGFADDLCKLRGADQGMVLRQ